MDLTDYNQRLVDLAQKWMTGFITEAEYLELDNWYRSWEDTSLGCPVEMTVDKLEKRLHEQLYRNIKPPETDGDFNAAQLFGKQ
jgi:hypothetical protein